MDDQIPDVPAMPARVHPPCADFAIKKMEKGKAVYAFLNWICTYPQREWLMRVFRRLPPITFFGILFVLRDDDVREVLAHDREFPVPWDEKMKQLSQGTNFLLGMANGAEYELNYKQLAQAFKREDVARYVVPQSAKISAGILRNTSPIDVIRELIWQVPAQLCEDYYGIGIPDKYQFVQWTIAMSGYLFGPFSHARPGMGEDPAMAAAECFRIVIRNAIEKTREAIGQKRKAPGIVLPRLITMLNEGKLAEDVLEADLFGMVTGFVPTNLLAAGNLLVTLLNKKDFMAQARRAALNDDDDALWRCLQETLRFNSLNLGPFRRCGPKPYTLAAGTWHERRVKPHKMVLASTQSAMFDRHRIARPHHFNPNRAAEDYMIFGYGQHRCMNAFMAIAQITQTFKVLLRMPEMRPARGKAGKLRRITVFPASLTVEFRA